MDGFKCFAVISLFVIYMNVSSAFPKAFEKYNRFPSSEILKDFTRARPRLHHIAQEPPQYMLDLYNKVANRNGETKSPLPHGASLVRAVPIKAFRDHRFTFSLENIPPEEVILEAEVHIHQQKLSADQRELIGNQNLYKLSLFMIDIDGTSKLAKSHTVGGHFNGWRIFSVGKVLKEARKRGVNVSFYVEASTLENNLVLDSKIHHGHQNVNNPLLVLFNNVTKQNQSISIDKEFTMRKDRVFSSSKRRVTRSVGDESSSLPRDLPSGCELQSLSVDFEKIGWTWVIAPHTYDAHHCIGKCAFPLGQELNPTNHATVVSMVHYSSAEKGNVQSPTCVPTAYESMAIMYYDKEERVLLQTFTGMIATQCGCR